MALVLALITYVPAILMLYWVLATGAALFTLLLGDLGPAFRCEMLLPPLCKLYFFVIF